MASNNLSWLFDQIWCFEDSLVKVEIGVIEIKNYG